MLQHCPTAQPGACRTTRQCHSQPASVLCELTPAAAAVSDASGQHTPNTHPRPHPHPHTHTHTHSSSSSSRVSRKQPPARSNTGSDDAECPYRSNAPRSRCDIQPHDAALPQHTTIPGTAAPAAQSAVEPRTHAQTTNAAHDMQSNESARPAPATMEIHAKCMWVTYVVGRVVITAVRRMRCHISSQSQAVR
jgi:hypothetical protein